VFLPRRINIKKLTVIDRDLLRIKLYVSCSKGTYIRTLCHDIGASLGYGAILTDLMRIKVGDYTLDCAVELSELRDAFDINKKIIPIEKALHFESITVKQGNEKLVRHGIPFNQLCVEEDIYINKDKTMVRIFSYNKEEFLAVGEKKEYNHILIRRGFNNLTLK
ncbi:MAG: hypothetical protein HY934_01810, partial [Candidatus Firestonebacteria bacterium]|nr:hypothetical protein [Candidatus Firestonebacteria bacterium]